MEKRKAQNGKLIKLVGTLRLVVSFCGKVYGDKYEASTSVKVDRTLHTSQSFLDIGKGLKNPKLSTDI